MELIKKFGEHNIIIYGTYDKSLFNIRESIKDFTDKQKDVVSLTDTIGRVQESIMLTEQGVYKVLMRSRKPCRPKQRKNFTQY